MSTRGVEPEQIRKERDWLISLSTLFFSTPYVKKYAKIEHSIQTIRRAKGEQLELLGQRPLVMAELIHKLYSRVVRKIIRLHEKLSVIVNEPIHKVDNIYKKYKFAKDRHRVSEAKRLRSTLKRVLTGIKINKRLSASEAGSKLKRGSRW